MKGKIIMAIAAIFAITLLMSAYQPSNAAAVYAGHDGSVDDSLTKVTVEKIRGSNIWSYIVKACANDYTMGISAVILKSDIDQVPLGVNKNLGKGDCTYFGAVMRANDGNTLGAELIEKHEALEKYQSLENSFSSLSGKQLGKAVQEHLYYRILLGGLV